MIDAYRILLRMAEEWSIDHLSSYITSLEHQYAEIIEFVKALKKIEKARLRKTKRIPDSGPRGAT